MVELLELVLAIHLFRYPGGLWLEFVQTTTASFLNGVTEVVVILMERHSFDMNFDGSRELC